MLTASPHLRDERLKRIKLNEAGRKKHSVGTSSLESLPEMDTTGEMTPLTSKEHMVVRGRVSSTCEPRLRSISSDQITNAEQSSRNIQRKGKGSEKITERSMDTLWVNVRNSTSSVFAWSTISAPDPKQILLCLSAVIKTQMESNACSPSTEGYEPVSYFRTSSTIPGTANEVMPSVNSINNLLEHVFNRGRLSPECIIIALIYINRVIATTGLHIDGDNWQGIVCGSLLLAQKVWDDCSLRTSSFAKLFPSFTEEDVSVLRGALALLWLFFFS